MPNETTTPSEADFDAMSDEQLVQYMDGQGSEPSVAPEPPPAEPPPAEPVAEAAPEPPPAPPAEDDDEEGEGAGQPRNAIPYQKYARERKRYREQVAALEARLRETDEKFARGDERLRMLAEALKAPQPEQGKAEEDPEPDPNTDIVAWVNWSRREMGRLREGVTQNAQTVETTVAEQQLRDEYQRDAMSFAQQNPDFGPAYQHLLQARAGQLAALGYTDQQIQAQLVAEEKGLVQRARQTGKRPAEVIYGMAKAMGYRSEPKREEPPPAAAVPDPPPPPPAPKPSVSDEIQRIAAGQAAHKTLSGSGGAPQELSIEALASMSEKEFEAFYAAKRGQVDNLMGRAH